MSKPVPVFRTTNWSSYSRSLKRRYLVHSEQRGYAAQGAEVMLQRCR
ncbi:hypothetical protein [Paenirhodobacter populi]|nr:hypothetical protein [Sinirhodobacter populi]